MKSLSARLLKQLPVIAILALLISVLGFNHLMEIRGAEGRRALVTYEMMENGNMLVPYLHGYPYVNKPPFYNWVIGVFFWLFGTVNEYVLRLPGILSLLLTGWMFFRVGKKYMDRKVAMLGATAFITIADMLFYGTINAGEIDLFYCLLTTSQVMAIFYFSEQKRWLSLFVISYAIMAAGVLTKGLPSIAFQGITLLAYFIYMKQFKRLFGWQHFVGIGVSIGLVSGYFLAYSEYQDAIAYLVNTFKQASQQTANESSILDTVLQILTFPFEFSIKLMPWSLGLIFLASKQVRKALAQNRFISFCILFILANIPIYWTAPDLEYRYTYMFYPFFAMVFVYLLMLGFEYREKWQEWLTKFIRILIAIAAVGTLVMAFLDVGLTTNESTLLIITSVFIAFLSVMTFQSQWKLQHYWWLVAGLVIARIGYNLVGIPYTVRHINSFRAITTEILDKAGNQPLHYYGPPDVRNSNVSLFGEDFYVEPIVMPKDYASGFAFYDAKYRDEVMTLETEATSGAYYVLYTSELTDELVVVDTLYKMMGGRTMYVARGK